MLKIQIKKYNPARKYNNTPDFITLLDLANTPRPYIKKISPNNLVEAENNNTKWNENTINFKYLSFRNARVKILIGRSIKWILRRNLFLSISNWA